MKKIICLMSVAAAFLLSSCTSQDDIYQQYVKLGGYDYPAKPVSLTCNKGYKRLVVNWVKPMDPAVKTAKLYWDNYTQSLDIDYADYPDGNVSINVADLEDRSYTFDIVNFDSKGNKSLAAEVTSAPYSDSWMVSRSERTVLGARMNGNDAEISMSKSTDEMIATRFRYKDRNDKWVEVEDYLPTDRQSLTFPDALAGKYFEYSSAFCPTNGLDTVWRSWTKSSDGISYKLNAKRWSVNATNGQVFSDNGAEKIFDGYVLSGCRWHSSKADNNKQQFPKILAIDTQTTTGNEYAFTAFNFRENPESASMRYIKHFLIYVGSKVYDPDDASYKDNYGIQFLDGMLGISEADSEISATSGATGRYLAIVFTDSWNTEDGFVDLWELEAYGYIPSQAD